MDGEPGHGAVGVDSTDVLAEHARLAARGVDVGPTPTRGPGSPLLFSVRDPDGNTVWVVGRD
jgi:lactoylglutathione lyase